jgi:hypothetical protein
MSFVDANRLVLSIPLSGLPTKPRWAGWTPKWSKTFPTLSVSTPHIIADTNRYKKSLVKEPEGILGTNSAVLRCAITGATVA